MKSTAGGVMNCHRAVDRNDARETQKRSPKMHSCIVGERVILAMPRNCSYSAAGPRSKNKPSSNSTCTSDTGLFMLVNVWPRPL
jgi:hypothetical protein